MPTHLPPEIQKTLTGFWCYGQNGLSAQILARLVDDILPAETVADWIELVRYLPPGMLRPSDPPAAHWHARLADYCEKNQSDCRYALNWLVQHHLSAGQSEPAVRWLSDFDYLYRRLQLGSSQARQVWQELLQLPPEERPGEWEAFWRGRQFLVDPSWEPNPEPQLTFLALADAYSEGSSISSQAGRWLERVGPEKHWLRLRFRPTRPYSHPMVLELPERPSESGESHHEWVSQLLFSPDGRRLLSVTSLGEARAFEVHSGRDLGHLELPPAVYQWLEDGLLALAENKLFLLDPNSFDILQTQTLPGEKAWGLQFAAASERLVTSNSQGQVLVWDWRKQRSLSLLPAAERGIQELSLSRDGQRVTVISESEAQGCDLNVSGKPHRYHRSIKRPWSESWAEGRVRLRGQRLEFADGGALLAEQVEEVWEWCCQGDWAFLWDHGSWTAWNLAEKRRVAQFGWPEPDHQVHRDSKERYVVTRTQEILGRSECVRLDQRRERALTWKLGNSTAQVLELESSQVVATLGGQRDPLTHGCISADGRRAATVTRAGNLRIWDTRNGKCLRLLKGKAVNAALNQDGSLALSGDAEGQIRLWDLSRGHCLTILEGHQHPIDWLAFGEDGRLVSGDHECFRLWGQDRQCLGLVPRPPRLYAREISPCGRFLYAERIGSDRWGQAVVYDLESGKVKDHLPCPSSKPSGSCFAQDSMLLAVANQEGQFYQSCSLRVWQGERTIESYRIPRAKNSLALNQTHLAASSDGREIRIWEREPGIAPGHDAAVLCLDRDGQRLITGGIDKAACVWSLETGQCLRRLCPGDRWIQSVGLRGPYAFCGSEHDSTLWDLERDQPIPGGLFPEAVNPQGEILSYEGKYLLWSSPRVRSSKPIKLGPHAPAIRCCAFSPDGTRAISASTRGALKLWDLASQRCLKSWESPLTAVEGLFWVEPQVVLLRAGDGRQWAWDLEHGTGSRIEEESEGIGQLRLDFGTGWQGKPLQVWGRNQPLACWWFPIQSALVHDSNRLVVAQDSGELHFLELLPPGQVGSPAPPRVDSRRKAVRARQSGLQRTPLDRLNPCQRVLLVASGGRSDLLAAVPLSHSLAELGKQVFLAAPLSGRKQSEGYREIPPKGKNFENRLAGLLGKPLYAFAPEGTLPRLEVYRDLVRDLSVDGLVLVEAGMETLLRGDEPSLGTAADDLVSLAAAQQLELPLKMLANLGLGFDLGKGLCHAYTLEAIAELTQSGGFWGSFSLLPGGPEFALLLEASRLLAPSHPVHGLMQGLAGEFGGDTYLNPLMNQYWCFDLDHVAAHCRPLEWLENKITAMDVHRALTNYLTVQTLRPWMEISC